MKGLGSLVLLFFALAGPLTAQGHGGSCTCGGFAAVPSQWEIEHAGQSDYAAAAAATFDRWNQYVDVFSYHAGNGDMAPNGTNEIGFLSHAATSANYGINLDRNTFAITYMTPTSADGGFDACPKPPEAVCGSFTETDVIMNPDFFRGFKASGPPDFADAGPALYEATAVHELGHAAGFHHNVSSISAMNLYEDYAARYVATSDTQEARAAYPAKAQRITDLAAYPFFFDPQLTDYAATTPVDVSPATAHPNGTITIRNFGFENVGTETVTDVQIRFYLSADGEITSGDELLGSLAFSGPIEAGAFWDDERLGRSFPLPAGLPFGTYSVGALIVDASGQTDAATYNNGWTAPQRITLVPFQRRRATRH